MGEPAQNQHIDRQVLYSKLMKKLLGYFGFFLIFFGSFKIITWISRVDLDGALRNSGIFFTGLAIIIIWFFLKGYKE